jgi:hypothetical protein
MLTETLIRIFIPSGDLSLADEKMRKINLPQASSDMILQNHRRLPVSIFRVKIAALGL